MRVVLPESICAEIPIFLWNVSRALSASVSWYVFRRLAVMFAASFAFSCAFSSAVTSSSDFAFVAVAADAWRRWYKQADHGRVFVREKETSLLASETGSWRDEESIVGAVNFHLRDDILRGCD